MNSKVINYGLAGIIFLGSYLSPMTVRAQVVTNTAKQQFFDTIVNYTNKQGLNLKKIDSNNVEIKEKVIVENEEVWGSFNKFTRRIQIKDMKLEEMATTGLHEITHNEMYDPEKETEMWFEKIPYRIEKRNDLYIATVDKTKLKKESKIAKNLDNLTIKEESNAYYVYDENGNNLAKLELAKLRANDNSTTKVMKAPYQLLGLEGEFEFEKISNGDIEICLMNYVPSDIISFYNEIIARIYEQVFSGYYVGKTTYQRGYDQERSILGKSLEYMTNTFKGTKLTPEQQKISKNAEEAYIRLNEEALISILEKTIQVGGKTLKELMEDLKDDNFTKTLTLASLTMNRGDFKTIIDLYDDKGKDAVKQLLIPQVNEFEEKKTIGNMGESDLVIAHLKKFNLTDQEAAHVLKQLKYKTFNDILQSKEKVKHIEKIKQQNLERLMEQFRPYEKIITKGL